MSTSLHEKVTSLQTITNIYKYEIPSLNQFIHKVYLLKKKCKCTFLKIVSSRGDEREDIT